jgi:hypothetical protein
MRFAGRGAREFSLDRSLDALIGSVTEGWFAVMDIAGIVLGYISVIGGLLIAPLAIIIGCRLKQRNRELEHIERMKALEFGRSLPQDEPWLSPTKIGAAIGIIVPLAAFSAACTATQQAGYNEAIWIAAAMVGVAGVICGPILVVSALKYPAAPAESPQDKPYVEEDAYDVVGSRG